MRRRRRWVWWLAGAFGFLALIAALAAWSLRSAGRAQRSGRATIPGLSAAVSVRFDDYAVPHVRAESLADLGAAVGWLHANERMTQLEIGRRLAAGRLSEVFGAVALNVDKRMRHFGLERAAERMWEAMSADTRALVEGYTRGVNAWLTERGGDLPPGLRLVRVRPEPWRTADSLGFALLLAHDLTYPRMRDELRYAWLGAISDERLRDIERDPELEIPTEVAALARPKFEQIRITFPEDPSAGEVRTWSIEELRKQSPGEGGGSNNWAIPPSLTTTGAPIVANDPHLALGLPCTWYQARLSAPGYEAAGVTLPGLPLVIIGQGEHVTWSFTNAEVDTTDLFLEKVEDGRVARGDGWADIETREDVIRVRFGEDVPIELRWSDIGPMMPARGPLPSRSLAWTALEPFDPLALVLELARAPSLTNAPDLDRALAEFVAPMQNMLAADSSGEVLSTVIGRVPERGRGDGRLPAPGWDPDYAWRGLRPQADNPARRAPDEPLATANQDPRDETYARPYRGDFASPHRAERILQRLAERESWSLEDAAAVQTDVLSLYALEAVEALGPDPAEAGSDEARHAHAALRAWDGRFAERGAAALFALFEREVAEAVFGDDLERAHLPALPGHQRSHLLPEVLRGELDASWYDDRRTQEVETRDDQVRSALEAAWRAGEARFGPDVASWDYGSMHTWTATHPLEALPLVGAWFNRGPFEVGGAATCVQVFAGSWTGELFAVQHGPSMRWISDPADPDASRIVIAGGQAGHPADEHYADQIPLLLQGRTRPVRWSEEAIEAATRSRLSIEP